MSDIESFTDGLCDTLNIDYYSVIVNEGEVTESSIDTGKFEITIRRSVTANF